MSSRAASPRLVAGPGRTLYWVLLVAVILVVLIVASPSASWAQAVTGTPPRRGDGRPGRGDPRRHRDRDGDGHEHRPHRPDQRQRQLHLLEPEGRHLPGRRRDARLPEGRARQASSSTSIPPCASTSRSRWGSSATRRRSSAEIPPLQTDRADTGRILERSRSRRSARPSTATSRAAGDRARGHATASVRTRSSSTRRTACPPTSTDRPASPTT